jgi:hypothetical protein
MSPGGIRTRSPITRAAADLRLKARGHGDRHYRTAPGAFVGQYEIECQKMHCMNDVTVKENHVAAYCL